MSREKIIHMPNPDRSGERYRVAPCSIEESMRHMAEYEATPDGARFLRSLELAREFVPRNKWGGLRLMHLFYLLNMADAEGADKAISEAVNHAYRTGYLAGQRDAKKRASKKG